jgi:NTP pyrophosphatase (non-canonical NTP hydrolase)
MRHIKVIETFADDMQRQIEANSYKGGWKKEPIGWLFDRLRQESDELLIEIRKFEDSWMERDKKILIQLRKSIITEAADVANFAMMIADNLR